ncbi:MAG: RNA 2',3'-cyclic phosphodiesterase [Thermoplasmata archaeon]|nr:RNA 2',3'-cyclic phosphodiesterase [Thermoplasmata archaeon]
MTRVFVSIPVGNASGLEPLYRDLSGKRGVRTSPKFQLHITLCFIGEIPEERVEEVGEIVSASVKGIKPGRITLKGVGCFPNPKRPRILYVGLETGIPLESLASEIRRRLSTNGIPFDEKPFKPHITVGRIQGPADLSVLIGKYRTTEFATFIAHDVMVMGSELSPEGAKHTILKSCELR